MEDSNCNLKLFHCSLFFWELPYLGSYISNKEGTRALESMVFRFFSRSNMWSFLGGYEFESEWDSLIFCYREVMGKFQKSPKSKDSRDWSWTWAVKKALSFACSGCFQGWSTAMEHWVAPQIPSKWFPLDLNVLVFGLDFFVVAKAFPKKILPTIKQSNVLPINHRMKNCQNPP